MLPIFVFEKYDGHNLSFRVFSLQVHLLSLLFDIWCFWKWLQWKFTLHLISSNILSNSSLQKWNFSSYNLRTKYASNFCWIFQRLGKFREFANGGFWSKLVWKLGHPVDLLAGLELVLFNISWGPLALKNVPKKKNYWFLMEQKWLRLLAANKLE